MQPEVKPIMSIAERAKTDLAKTNQWWFDRLEEAREEIAALKEERRTDDTFEVLTGMTLKPTIRLSAAHDANDALKVELEDLRATYYKCAKALGAAEWRLVLANSESARLGGEAQ